MSILTSSYPGRGIILGKSRNGEKVFQIYWIMGRSTNSQNRVFDKAENGITITPFDYSKVEDPSLIIYHPMKLVGDTHIVSNGDQTDTIENYLAEGRTFEEAIKSRMFEPDAPNYTPRISGIIDVKNSEYKLSIVKTIANQEQFYSHQFYNYNDIENGKGFGISTYIDDGVILKPYSGEPELLDVGNSNEENLDKFWNTLNPDFRISIAIKSINLKDGESEVLVYNKNKIAS